VEYLGELGHDDKVALLGGATATLFPIDWAVSAYESLLAPPQPSRGPRRWRRPRPALAGELGPIRGSLVRGR
jgi:hypothetical protein